MSFDRYGTLIDGERGILLVLTQLLSSRERDLGKSATRQNRIWGDTTCQWPARLGSSGFENIGGGYRVKKSPINADL
ncbi:hypothetical protein QUA32_21695 [Microcoleus sp. Pol14D6]|uniref:hypothetical protein n=1 Tax=unclassified Microcoleus TaxID=2642155 RepID=UPI002FD3D0A6